MLELEFGGQRFSIPPGESAIGAEASCLIQLPGAGVLPRHAMIRAGADGNLAVWPAEPGAAVFINGVKLGSDPSPILHGDKLQVGLDELLCVDPHRSGSTQFVNAADVAKMAMGMKASPGSKPATASTGGRLVCLTDGREYTIGSGPLVFGREAGSDIVVPNKDVSRRHAEIMSTPQGYVVVDSSTNGTFVNGERVQGQRVLARADVIRVGDHDFRFYADAASAGNPAPA
ncbi:MAG TPA: FHA domain-containing protein, partial [Gemmatimonadales bacterium]|nr:FHA domain-containing protein [Gemmatimonadales bacterium]